MARVKEHHRDFEIQREPVLGSSPFDGTSF